MNEEYTSPEFAEEKAFLDDTYRFLKYERTAWKVTAIVFLVFTVFFVAFGLIFMGIFSQYDDVSMAIGGSLGLIYIVLGFVYLPISVIGFIMAGKCTKYMNVVYTDIKTVTDRTSSIGMLVFTALFNTIAMIFFIINFVKTRSNAQIIERIRSKQNV